MDYLEQADLYDPVIRYTFSGSYEEYLQLLKVAYLNIKEVNPRAKVITGGMTYSQGQRNWSDALPIGSHGSAEERPRPREVRQLLRHIGAPYIRQPAELLRASYVGQTVDGSPWYKKPIWINESNVVPFNDPVQPPSTGQTRATLDDQASYVVQSYAMGISAGVERQAIYKMVDEEAEQGQYYGLVRNNGTTRPAYTAFQVVASYFAAVKSAYYTSQGYRGRRSLTTSIAYSKA